MIINLTGNVGWLGSVDVALPLKGTQMFVAPYLPF